MKIFLFKKNMNLEELNNIIPHYITNPEYSERLNVLSHTIDHCEKNRVYMFNDTNEMVHYAEICAQYPEKANQILEEMINSYPKEGKFIKSDFRYIQSLYYQIGYYGYDKDYDYKTPLRNHFKKYKKKLASLVEKPKI